MRIDSEHGFFRWLGTASIGTLIGLAVGTLVGLAGGAAAGGWLWYEMWATNDGTSSADAANLLGMFVTVFAAVIGLLIGMIGGGVVGLAGGSLFSMLSGGTKSRPR